ncbi:MULTISPECIES: DcrB-related protein [unclassified Coleofasciculus]|uniref:DcrB-related protein n=1 Tax=unclassified Coleofasciculus TaxID=2692782 RepID=UPI00187FDA8F|nr:MULTISPECIES: DcrB-related protein [unclassified Coleofasciculus]MBE9127939.1 hypothetical protein [Coleofasciculus sp. LEGE 07081]MBE9151099.1 hypothetical protein [Coleofasciculus sp. LEGE 07092]
MIEPIQGLFVCLLVLSTLIGCGERSTPQDTETFQDQSQAKTQIEDAAVAAPEVGWKAIAGEGVTLSLPKHYEGGNPHTDINTIAAKLEKVSPGYSARLEAIKQNPQAIALLAFDPKTANSGFMTNVNITKEKVPTGVTIQQYLEAATQQLVERYEILEQKVVSIDPYQGGRIVAKSTTGETPIQQLFYIVQDGNTFWLVTYSTTVAEFDQRLPTFEQSIATLKLPQSN